MSESRRKDLGIPIKALKRVVSKAKHLRTGSLTAAAWQDLKKSEERTWLFNPPTEIIRHPKVRRYLGLKVEDGGCRKTAYKVAIRTPWYQTPMPRVPDAFISGMSQFGPWLCINEARDVNATNTLYTVNFSSRDRQEWYKIALGLLTFDCQRQIRRIGRRYPDGLMKYEPGSLCKVVLPLMVPGLNYKQLYNRAVTAFLSGNATKARQIADSCISEG